MSAVPLRCSAIGPFAFGAFRTLDRLLLSLPGLRWQAWYALLRLER